MTSQALKSLAAELAPILAPIVASEVIRQMRQMEDRTLDAEYMATLPSEQVKKIQQEKMRKARAALNNKTQPRKGH